MNKSIIPTEYIRHLIGNIRSALKWSVFGIVCGLVVGAVSGAFGRLIVMGTSLRELHPRL